MSARVARMARHMTLARASILVFVVVALLTTLFMIKMSQGEALPGSPTDRPAVPHYFGPWPNWALSPTDDGQRAGHHHRRRHRRDGDGHGRRQRRHHRHHRHQPRQRLHDRDGEHRRRRHGRRGDRGHHQQRRGHRVTVGAHGSGYKKPAVTFSGGGATTAATATAYGGVDAVTVANAGTGYTSRRSTSTCRTTPTAPRPRPTPPRTPHGAITGDRHRQPRLRATPPAPNVVIRDGTLIDPIANGGAGASATCHPQRPQRRRSTPSAPATPPPRR